MKNMIPRFRRLISFGVCGVINTLTDYAVFALLYELLGLDSGVSQSTGFLAGSVCGYLLNSNVTFREGKGRTRAQFAQYVGVDLLLTAVSGFLMRWLARDVGINAWIVKLGLTAVTALLHYIIFKYLVFRIKKEDDR